MRHVFSVISMSVCVTLWATENFDETPPVVKLCSSPGNPLSGGVLALFRLMAQSQGRRWELVTSTAGYLIRCARPEIATAG